MELVQPGGVALPADYADPSRARPPTGYSGGWPRPWATPAGHVKQARIVAAVVDQAASDSALPKRLLQALEALRKHEAAVLTAHHD